MIAVGIVPKLNKDNLYLFTYELQVYPPPGHLATFGQIAVTANNTLLIHSISFGGVRTIDHDIANVYTFSIDAALSAELYSGVYASCLNLGSPNRMIFNAKGEANQNTYLNFDRGGFPLFGGENGSIYYWKLKNEDPLHGMTGNMTIIGEWL